MGQEMEEASEKDGEYSKVWLKTEIVRKAEMREYALWKFSNGKQRLKKKER